MRPRSRRPSRRPSPLLSLAVALGLSAAAHAAPQATTLDAVNVTAASETEQARAALKRVPGASNVVDLTKADGRLSTSADVLAYQPGISAQSPGNEGAKVSIRGSGINRGPGAHASGIAVSLDGLPLSGPGGTPYELLEPLWLSRAEVLRGANGFERGALALGGAINYVSRNGRDSAGLELQYEAGSRGYQKRSVGYGGVSGDVDYYLAYTDTESDGYQRHAASDGKGAMANLGWQITPTLETRFFVRYRETNHETPGRLTRAQIRNDPRAANPANLAIDAVALPVGKVVCIGQSYQDHITEMNSKTAPDALFFLKPATALRHFSAPLAIPHDRGAVHNETELLRLALTDILNQTYNHFEIIVVVDDALPARDKGAALSGAENVGDKEGKFVVVIRWDEGPLLGAVIAVLVDGIVVAVVIAVVTGDTEGKSVKSGKRSPAPLES